MDMNLIIDNEGSYAITVLTTIVNNCYIVAAGQIGLPNVICVFSKKNIEDIAKLITRSSQMPRVSTVRGADTKHAPLAAHHARQYRSRCGRGLWPNFPRLGMPRWSSALAHPGNFAPRSMLVPFAVRA